MSTLPRQELNARQAETVERLLDGRGARSCARSGRRRLTSAPSPAARASRRRRRTPTSPPSNHLFAELFHRKVLLEHPAEITGATPLERVQSVTRHLADRARRASPHLAAAANHALLGTDPDVERLRVVIGAEIFGRFRDGARRGRGRPSSSTPSTLALTGALLQTGMGLISYDDLADRLDARVATIMKGNA